MNLKKIASSIVAKAKRNPELALVVLGLFAPSIAGKVTQAIVVAKTVK